ncbi:MAG: tRNA (adenosine(37)-N6)-dimethylallyltransferase MiaA [Bacteroidota bacterium]|nr:tRNA (adenosine(37)-N6)-dimethylallyltransferase MiaA [Bacteroidota bacterium]
MNLIVILGATATGKTILAANLAYKINGEIISADSRQVYKGMDIGTGKDIEDYIVNGTPIKHHIIDIVQAGYEYSVYEFQKDFKKAYSEITSKEKTPILCGGSGMYIESVLNSYNLINVPVNEKFRKELSDKPDEELINLLKSKKELHNKTDITDRNRLLRALEITCYYEEHSGTNKNETIRDYTIFGIKLEREVLREKITERLTKRLNCGLIDEVRNLLEAGITSDKLKYYGLEYKYISSYLINEISYEDMFKLLNTAIHQFAKRQETWFRRMEKNGFNIKWIDGKLSLQEKLNQIFSYNNFVSHNE